MSYDVWLFKPKEGVTVDDIMNFYESEDELDDEEAEEKEQEMIDQNYTEEKLFKVLLKPMLRNWLEPDKITDEIKEYLESSSEEQIMEKPRKEFEDNISWLDEIIHNNKANFSLTIGNGNIMLANIIGMLKDLASYNFVAYDPQLDKVIEASTKIENLYPNQDSNLNESERELTIRRSKIDENFGRIIKFLSIFEKPSFQCGQMVADKPGVFPHAIYNDSVRSFMRICRECGLILDIPEKRREQWDDLANRFCETPVLFETAKIEDLQIYLTMITELDSNMPGMLFFQFEEGNIVRLLRRLKELLKVSPVDDIRNFYESEGMFEKLKSRWKKFFQW